MLPGAWGFIRNSKNREVVSWLGGGAAVIAAGLWGVFTYFASPGDKRPAASTTTTITQSGPGIASGRDTVVNAPVNFGVDEKQVGQRIVDAQKPLADQLEKLAAQVAREKGVEIAPLRAILVRLGEAGVSDEDVPKRLDEKANELIKLREEIAQLRRGPPGLASFAQKAQALIDKGDFTGARDALASGRKAAHGLRELASRYEADFLAQEARIDRLQLAYRSAATKYAEAAGLIASVDAQQQWQFVLNQAHELHSQGDEFGDNSALFEAVDVYRKALVLALYSQRWFDWATTQNNLGNALSILGKRDSGTAKLEEAVVAYREVLKEWTRERVPLDWATTQNNLGNALSILGERESGTVKLEEAVAAYREAL
jgi:tetratricopeptide (TPR) repeat protein